MHVAVDWCCGLGLAWGHSTLVSLGLPSGERMGLWGVKG